MAQEFCRLMRLAWHELQTPVTVVAGYVTMLRKGRAGVVDPAEGGVGAMLAQIQPHLQRLGRLVMALRELSWTHTVVGAVGVCADFVPGLLVEASDEGRIVAAPSDEFAVHLLTLLLSLPDAGTDAFAASAEVLVTPEDCRVFLRPANLSASSGLKQQSHPSVTDDVTATVAALQRAGCTATFYEDSSGGRMIEVRWTRPLTNQHRGR